MVELNPSSDPAYKWMDQHLDEHRQKIREKENWTSTQQKAQQEEADVRARKQRLHERLANPYAEHNARSPADYYRQRVEKTAAGQYLEGLNKGKKTGRMEGFVVGVATVFWFVFVWILLTE